MEEVEHQHPCILSAHTEAGLGPRLQMTDGPALIEVVKLIDTGEEHPAGHQNLARC